MSFWIGDLIVLVIVISVIVWFRRSDRDNRSLEKVKRFSDKVIEDLDLIVNEKAQNLRDIANEVEVHQELNRKALQKLKEAEDSLEAKTQELNDLRQRMDAYNQALLELVSMTQKAEENIGRLRDESAYIDKVGRRIKTATGQLQEIETRIPHIISEVHSQNEVSLNATKDSLLNELHGKLDEIGGRMVQSNSFAQEIIQTMRRDVIAVQEDLSQKASNYKDAFATIESDYLSRLQEVARQGMNLEHESMEVLRRTIGDDQAKFLGHIDSVKEQMLANLSDIKAEGEKRFSSARSEVKDLVEEKRAQFLSEIEMFKSEMGDWTQELRAQVKLDFDTLESRVESEKQAMSDKVDHFVDITDHAQHSLKDQYDQAVERHADEAKQFMENVGIRVEGLETAMYRIEEEIKSKLIETQAKGVELADNLLMKIDQNVETKTDAMKESIQRRVEEVSDRVQNAHEQIEEDFSGLKNRVDSWISESRGFIATLDEQVRTLNEESQRANIEHKNTVQGHISETKERLDTYEKGLSSRVEALELFISKAESMVTDEFSKLENLAHNLSEQNEIRLRDSWEEYRVSTHNRQDQGFKTLQEGLDAEHEKIRVEMGQIMREVHEGIQGFRTDLDHAWVENQKRSDEIGSLQDHMQTHLLAWRDQMDNLVTSHAELLSVAKDRIVDQGNESEAHLRADLERLHNGIRSNILSERAKLEEAFKELELHGNGLRDQLSDNFSSLVHSIQENAQNLYAKIQTEIDASYGEQQSRVTGLIASLESDIAQLNAVGKESSESLKTWRDQVQAGEQTIRADLQQVSDQLMSYAQAQNETNKAQIIDWQQNEQKLIGELTGQLQHEMGKIRSVTQGDLEKARAEMFARHTEITEQIKLFAKGLEGSLAQADEMSKTEASRMRAYIDGFRSELEAQVKSYNEKLQNDLVRIRSMNESEIDLARVELGNRQKDFSSEIEEIHQAMRVGLTQARDFTMREVDGVKADVEGRQNEISASLIELVSKLKSEITHAKGDIDQDMEYLRKHIEGVKLGFQDQLRAIEANSKELESQAITGLKDRIEELKEESKVLTRKYQDEFTQAMQGIQVSIQNQSDYYQNELRKSQGLGKEIMANFQRIQEEHEKHSQSLRQVLEREHAAGANAAAVAKEEFMRQLDEVKNLMSTKAQEVTKEIEASIDRYKGSGEAHFQTVIQQVQKWQADYQDRIKNLVAEASNIRKDAMSGIQERVDAMRDEARKLTGAVLEEVQKQVNAHQSGISKQLLQTEEEARRIEDLQNASKLRFNEIQDILGKAESSAIREIGDLRDKIKLQTEDVHASVTQELQNQREEFQRRMEQSLIEVKEKTHEELSVLESRIDEFSNLGTRELNRVNTEFTELRNRFVAEMRTQNEQQALESKRQIAEASQRFAEGEKFGKMTQELVGTIQTELNAQIGQLHEQIDQMTKNMETSIKTSTENREQAAFAEIEKRLRDYESEIGYRITKLERVNDDIDGLELGLRQSMDRLTLKLKDDLDILSNEFHSLRAKDIDMAHKDMDALKLDMVSMDKEIDELKSRAYDNINEKLKVFEDDFFVDLTNRSQAMQSKFESFKTEVAGVLDSIQSNAQRERERVESSYNENLRAKMNEVQDRLFAGFERLQSEFGAFNQGLESRMQTTEKSLESLNLSLKSEIGSLESGAREFALSEIARLRGDLDEQLRSHSRELDQKLSAGDQTIRARLGDLGEMMETMRSDVTTWQSSVLQEIRSSESQTELEITSFKTKTGQVIEEMRLDFNAQRNELAHAGDAERQEIKQDLDLIQSRMDRMGTEIDQRAKDSIELFNKQFQTFFADMSQQNAELSEDITSKITNFRGIVHDTRVEFDNLSKRLLSKIDEDAKVLDGTLRDIDKRIRAFTAQTKLFERADVLKDDLEQKISLLRTDLDMIETQKRELINLDPVIEKVRKLTDEVHEKFNKLSDEKKRLEGMDEDFKRLSGLSQVVDSKLSQINDANDTLTNIQLSLRQVDESQRQVDAKLERLEKKARIIEATAETVDHNFQSLQDLEVKLRDIKEVYAELPTRVQDTQDKVTQLIGGKKDLDGAIKNLSTLDKSLKEIEARTIELQKSKEWIARTETRMGEITREAQESIAVLGNLVKKEVQSENGASNRSTGVPTRDLVLKLANQGWKIEEIAKTTKLSRGEIELILEMSNK